MEKLLSVSQDLSLSRTKKHNTIIWVTSSLKNMYMHLGKDLTTSYPTMNMKISYNEKKK